MASPTTPITTNAGHATVFESRHQVTQAGNHFSTYLHFAVSRSGGWDGGEPSPTFFELMDGIWSKVWEPWMTFHAQDTLALTKLRVSEITDVDLVSGQPVPIYGDFCELTDFTGFAADVASTSLTIPAIYYPTFTSIYCLKQKDASPRNINGSIRYGPVPVEFAVDGDVNRLDASVKAALQTSMESALIGDFQVTAADGGNVADVECGILQKTPAIGLGTPWDFMSFLDRVKVRYNLGTQNTRKRTRNTYT